MTDHCTDNEADRALGKLWERAFMALVKRFKHCPVIPNQQNHEGAAVAYGPDGKLMTIADVQVLADPNEHHEIKHKNATRDGCYGLEEFRFKSLYQLTSYHVGEVLYTIHDWDLAGGRELKVNKLKHWRTVRIADLARCQYKVRVGSTWCNGHLEQRPIYYWPTDAWTALASWWNVGPTAKPAPDKVWTPETLAWLDDYVAAERKYWGTP